MTVGGLGLTAHFAREGSLYFFFMHACQLGQGLRCHHAVTGTPPPTHPPSQEPGGKGVGQLEHPLQGELPSTLLLRCCNWAVAMDVATFSVVISWFLPSF